MPKLSRVAGATSVDVNVFIQDTTSTTGAGLTGLVFNTASLTAYYHRQGANAAVAISLATKTLGTWATAGFIVVDGTNMPGLYELGIPDAALAAGAKWVIIMLKGAANMAPVLLEIELTAWDNQDAVRGGMTALPNASAGASGGLPTGDASGRVDLGKILGTAASTPATAGILDINVKNMNNVAATAITTIKAVQGLTTADTIATYTGNTPQTGDNYARLGAPAGASISVDIAEANADLDEIITTIGAAGAGLTALGDTRIANLDATVSSRSTLGGTAQTGDSFARIGAAGAGLTALGDTRIANLDATISSRTKPADTQARVTLVDTVTTLTGNTPQTGDNFARLGAPAGASVSADIAAVKSDSAAIKAKTDNLPASPADETLIIAATNSILARTDVATSTRLATASYTAPDNADIVAIKAKTDNLPASPAATGGQMDLVNVPNATALNAIADAELDRANAIETGLTPRQAHRLEAAAAAAKLSGAATNTVTIRNAVADSKNRIVATVDANGNRTAVTTDVS